MSTFSDCQHGFVQSNVMCSHFFLVVPCLSQFSIFSFNCKLISHNSVFFFAIVSLSHISDFFLTTGNLYFKMCTFSSNCKLISHNLHIFLMIVSLYLTIHTFFSQFSIFSCKLQVHMSQFALFPHNYKFISQFILFPHNFTFFFPSNFVFIYHDIYIYYISLYQVL